MTDELDSIAISVKTHRLVDRLMVENPDLRQMILDAADPACARASIRRWTMNRLSLAASRFVEADQPDRAMFEALDWADYAAIRILDYIPNAGVKFDDPNLRGDKVLSDPFGLLWWAFHQGTGGIKPEFVIDMLHLFR